MKVIKVVELPNRKHKAITVVDTEKPSVFHIIGYVYHYEDMFIQALIDSKNVKYVLGDKE